MVQYVFLNISNKLEQVPKIECVGSFVGVLLLVQTVAFTPSTRLCLWSRAARSNWAASVASTETELHLPVLRVLFSSETLSQIYN